MDKWVKDYEKLLSPFLLEDGSIDADALQKASVYDESFIYKRLRIEQELAQLLTTLGNTEDKVITKALVNVYKDNFTNIAKDLNTTFNHLDTKAVEAAVKTPFTRDGREFSDRV